MERDCTTCGLCCSTGLIVDAYPYKVPEHMIGIDWDPAAEVEYPMRQINGRCVALAGKPLQRCRCTVYEDRPSDCRDFKPGSPECLRLIKKAGA